MPMTEKELALKSEKVLISYLRLLMIELLMYLSLLEFYGLVELPEF